MANIYIHKDEVYRTRVEDVTDSSLFFYPIASTENVLLMESKQNGIEEFVSSLSTKKHSDKIGALVMNCNPFTLGHLSLIESAAAECDHVYVFVLSEDKSRFSANDRLAMVKLGVVHLENVSVCARCSFTPAAVYSLKIPRCPWESNGFRTYGA